MKKFPNFAKVFKIFLIALIVVLGGSCAKNLTPEQMTDRTETALYKAAKNLSNLALIYARDYNPELKEKIEGYLSTVARELQSITEDGVVSAEDITGAMANLGYRINDEADYIQNQELATGFRDAIADAGSIIGLFIVEGDIPENYIRYSKAISDGLLKGIEMNSQGEN